MSRHVQENAPKGDLDAVLHAVEDFTQKVRWLKAGRSAKPGVNVELEMTSCQKSMVPLSKEVQGSCIHLASQQSTL